MNRGGTKKGGYLPDDFSRSVCILTKKIQGENQIPPERFSIVTITYQLVRLRHCPHHALLYPFQIEHALLPNRKTDSFSRLILKNHYPFETPLSP
jgi:hypothetical protein